MKRIFNYKTGIITIKGDSAGKTVSIMAGVHGNEICGVKALRKIIKNITIESGKAHFIFANLPAIAMDLRQTEMNLNRAFRPEKNLTSDERQSYERHRAIELMPYLEESNALLDIHSSHNEASTPFIICEPNSFFIAKKLPFPICSNGWDVIEPGGTDYFVNRNHLKGHGICIECGYHFDQRAPELAMESINIFLNLMGLTSDYKKYSQTKQREILVKYIYLTQSNFTIAKPFADFEKIKKGTLIGYDNKQPINAHFDGVIIFPNNCQGANQEAFILGEEK
jgi:succinylglutamate desuccinylase